MPESIAFCGGTPKLLRKLKGCRIVREPRPDQDYELERSQEGREIAAPLLTYLKDTNLSNLCVLIAGSTTLTTSAVAGQSPPYALNNQCVSQSLLRSQSCVCRNY